MRRDSAASRSALLSWLLLRVPVVLLVALVFREQVASLVEAVFDIARVTESAIGVLGTPLSRALLFAAALLAFVLLLVGLDRKGAREWLVASVALLVLLVGAAHAGLLGKRSALLLALLVPPNLLPRALLEELGRTRAWRSVALVVPGLSELFFLRWHARWVTGTLRGNGGLELGGRAARLLAALIPATATACLLFQEGELIGAEQAVRLDARASKIESGNFNWIELDRNGRYLFASGHGVPRVRRYDTLALDAPPGEADVPTGAAQGFAYDDAAREIFVYNRDLPGVQVIDADTLRQKRVLPLPDLSPGDPWIVFEPQSDTFAIVSEADDQVGVPFQVLERQSGRVLDKRNEDPGNLLLDPARPLLYLGYFRRSVGVRSYDLLQRKFGVFQATPSRPDRLTFWPKQDEVLVAIPMASRILRLEAGTLRPKGFIPSVFGVRTMAIDAERQLLFSGSLVTGALSVMSLENQRELARFYVSPWLRTIVVDPKREVAYVTANGGLYRLDYRGLR